MITLTHICILIIGIVIGMILGIAIHRFATELAKWDMSKPHDEYD